MKKYLKYLILAPIVALTFACGLIVAGCGGKVTLSFDAGEGSPVENITAEAGETVELPTSLRKGYVLAGWSAGEETYSGTIAAPEQDTNYTAVWAEGYEVTFDADGGVYAEGAPSLSLAAGASLYDAVKDIRPTKSGLDFGAWFIGETEVLPNTKMPAENVTLTAKYKVEYAMESYLLNLAGNSYVRSGEIKYASDYVGATVSPDAPEVTGFARTATPAGQSPVESVRLDADASKNVLKFYYDRLRFELVFSPDASGATGEVNRIQALYGETVSLPENNFAYEGYRFAGWSAFSGGEVEFSPSEPFPMMGDTILYAVWDKGFTDRYGGNDLVFFPRLEPEKAVLRRGNNEFEGTRDGDDFLFTPAAGDLKGRVYGSMFCYERDDLAGTYTFMEFVDEEQFTPRYDANRTLKIDNYLNAEYKRGTHTCQGEVVYSDETGDYVFTSADESFRFLSVISDAYEYDHTFLVGGEEVGSYVDFVMADADAGMGYKNNTMMLIIDGYGIAMLGDMSTGMAYDGRYYVEGIYTIGTADVYKLVCFFSDPDGLLTGVEGAVATNFVYTLPLDDGTGYDGYVQANGFRGEYEGESGETLSLDGFGPFADSFTYTAGGKTYKGRYSVSTDLMSGSVVNCETEDGDEFSFRVDTQGNTFSAPQSLVEGDYTEYRFMDGNTLRPPFLVLYDENKDGTAGKANVYMPSEDGSALVKAAEGKFTAEPIGNSVFSLYTFTRKSVAAGYADVVAEKLVFFNSVATSTTENLTYNIYCLLEQTLSGTKISYWNKYLLPDGGEIWRCNSVTAGGLGSLLIGGDGTVLQGQFSVGASEHFDGSVGSFDYVTNEGELASLYYDISKNDEGENVATPRNGTEQMVYVIQPTGILAGGVGTQMIFLDGVSSMKYTEDSGERYLEGSYFPDGTTCFGETVYSFTVGNTERFRFVIYTLPDYEGMTLAVKYDASFEREAGENLSGLTFRGVGSLVIDGYHTARYDAGDGRQMEGEYIRDELCQTVVFTAKDGTEYVLELDLTAKSFVQTDWAVGREWQLLDSNFEPINQYYAVFEDNFTEKTVTIFSSVGNVVSEGVYVVLDSVNDTWGHEEYLLRNVTFGTGYPEDVYRVTFAVNSEGVGACLVFNADADGVFTDDSWNVLVLDGYGRGQYSTSAFTGRGSYEVIDFTRNFISFTIDEDAGAAGGTEFYFLLQGGVLQATDYEKYAGVFFAENFESVAFGADGIAYLGNESGPYFVLGGKAYVYLTDSPTEVNAPSGDTYSYNNKTYRRWDGAAFSLEGKVLMRDKDENPVQAHPDLEATLTFTPNGTTNRNLAAVFTFEGEEYLEDGRPKKYDGYTLSLYAAGDSLMGGSVGEFSPTVAYGNSRYSIEFSYQGGTYSFTVHAGDTSVEYLDHNARYFDHEPGKDANGHDITITRGGRLYKNSFGFGAIMFEKPTLSGDLLYLFEEGDPTYGKPLHFENVPEESVQVVGYLPGYGNRLELAFTAENDGKQYLLNYYEYYQGGVYFWCYGLFSYEDVEAGGYTVRAKTLLYTKMSRTPAYLDAQDGSQKALGKITEVTLLDGETPLVVYDMGVTPQGYGRSIWLVERASVVANGSTGTCTWGTGYLVNFTAENGALSATVERYDFVQVVNYTENVFNLFFDEEGNLILAGVLAYYDLGSSNGYVCVCDPHDYKDNGDGTFTFYATWEGTEMLYTVKVEKGDDVTFQDADGKAVTKPGYTVTLTTSAAD